jgi:hypothetical protein
MAGKESSRSRVSREFTFFSFLWRFLAAAALIFATYNPTPYSFFHWVQTAVAEGNLGSAHFFVGALLLIGWAILIFATRNSLGTVGVVLGIILFATAVWFLIDLGVLNPDSISAMTWIVLVCLAGLLAIGLSWSHIWRRLTGQFEVADEDE